MTGQHTNASACEVEAIRSLYEIVHSGDASQTVMVVLEQISP